MEEIEGPTRTIRGLELWNTGSEKDGLLLAAGSEAILGSSSVARSRVFRVAYRHLL